MPHLHHLKQMELWLAMARKHQTAIIILTTKWLARLSLDHPVGTWATTLRSLPGTRTPQLPTPPLPSTLRCKPPRSLTLKHLSHISSHLVAQGRLS